MSSGTTLEELYLKVAQKGNRYGPEDERVSEYKLEEGKVDYIILLNYFYFITLYNIDNW